MIRYIHSSSYSSQYIIRSVINDTEKDEAAGRKIVRVPVVGTFVESYSPRRMHSIYITARFSGVSCRAERTEIMK